MTEEELRLAIVSAVTAMDENALNRLAFVTGLNGLSALYEETLQRTVLVAGHDVQTFWLGECRCHGSNPQKKIAVGRAVQLQPELIEMMRASPEVGLPPVYPGSIIVPCDRCNTATFQGPRIQEAKANNPDLAFMCHLCGMLELADAADEGELDSVSISDLGNTYDPKPRS
jgi:hypothetical protein